MLIRGNSRDELVATVAIIRTEALPPTVLSGLLDSVGSAVDLLPQRVGGAAIGTRPLLIESIGDDEILSAQRLVREWESSGYEGRTSLHSTYPANLQAVFNKPPLLFVAGSWDDEQDAKAISVVGTRSATQDGCKRAYRLASKLASMGVTVVSGMAKGIDTCAHEGALSAGGRTVAVMGTGIATRYPKENAPLASRILESGGALLSQFLPHQPPTKWTFPVRNVTMSGLSLATIVVEAGPTSGAKMQAEAALTHGRAVFLPQSLVEAFPWARMMIEQGFKGAFAIAIGSPEEVVERLEQHWDASPLLA